MEYLSFEIQNFKGAKKISLKLDGTPRANIFPLVGLNESGKSTILEALSHAGPEYIDFKKEDPSGGLIGAEDSLKFIPVSEKYNFNGKIAIKSVLRLSPKDRAAIIKFISTKFNYVVTKLDDTFTVERNFTFKDSTFLRQGTNWSVNPTVKKARGTKTFQIIGEQWQELIKFIRALMPKVLFFRNELFDIPDKIYIGKAIAEKTDVEVNAFYRDVVQDVLFAVDPSLNVDDHIVARKKSKNESDKHSLDSVLERMSAHMTKTVMQQWEKIFNRKLREKSIRVGCEVDESGLYYLQIRLIDGPEIFNINQRSTGFRWFFVFILLTQYRGYRNESAIFLYDEPASNLHSSAQQQLLNCFALLPNQFTIIYSTHSHYLIKPEWLDSTFVVRNEAAAELEDLENLSSAKTDIKIAKYRSFVSDNPNGLSYFQPILDVLQYVPSRFDFIKNAVLMEGKTDFYLMSYMADVQLKCGRSFDIMPCGGSGSVDQLITLYAGWGKEFIVLLDADDEGQKAKTRYLDKFGPLVSNRIITYSDIDPSWNKVGLEKITGDVDSAIFSNAAFPDGATTKKSFALAVQELLFHKKKITLKGDAEKNFEKIFHALEGAFLI